MARVVLYPVLYDHYSRRLVTVSFVLDCCQSDCVGGLCVKGEWKGVSAVEETCGSV